MGSTDGVSIFKVEATPEHVVTPNGARSRGVAAANSRVKDGGTVIEGKTTRFLDPAVRVQGRVVKVSATEVVGSNAGSIIKHSGDDYPSGISIHEGTLLDESEVISAGKHIKVGGTEGLGIPLLVSLLMASMSEVRTFETVPVRHGSVLGSVAISERRTSV